MSYSRREFLRVSALAAAAPVAPAFFPGAPRNLYELSDDPILRDGLYRSPALRTVQVSATGAVRANAMWEAGRAPHWFVESQRLGGDWIQAGLLQPDPTLISRAMPVLQWAFARQAPDGSYPGTGDPFHSTEIFVAETARGILLLRESGLPQWQKVADEIGPKLERSALWLLDPAQLGPGLKRNAAFTHRFYIITVAFGLAAKLSGNARLARGAADCAAQGIAKQTPEGSNPEKAGFDVSYHAAGLLYASRYWSECPDSDLKERLRTMLHKGAAWLAARVDSQGEVSAEGSTRTAGQEKLRTGEPKRVNFMEMAQMFCHVGRITREDSFRELGRLIAARHGPLGYGT